LIEGGYTIQYCSDTNELVLVIEEVLRSKNDQSRKYAKLTIYNFAINFNPLSSQPTLNYLVGVLMSLNE